MDYKSILLNASGARGGSQALEMALDLTKLFGAHLSGLYTYASAYYIYEFSHGAVSATLEGRERDARLAAERAVNGFQTLARRAGVTDSEWVCVGGDPLQALARRSHGADLLVTPPGSNLAPAAPASLDLPAGLALACGCPVLLVPDVSTSSRMPQRILIAYNARREAMRAVRDALPLLARARAIEILTIREGTDETDAEEPGQAAQTLLSRHGIASRLSPSNGTTGDVTEAILSRADEFGADLVCMGAYGHSRLREVALGGVTWHMLREATLPVLMSH